MSLVNKKTLLNYAWVLSLRPNLKAGKLGDYLEYLTARNCCLLTAPTVLVQAGVLSNAVVLTGLLHIAFTEHQGLPNISDCNETYDLARFIFYLTLQLKGLFVIWITKLCRVIAQYSKTTNANIDALLYVTEQQLWLYFSWEQDKNTTLRHISWALVGWILARKFHNFSSEKDKSYNRK